MDGSGPALRALDHAIAAARRDKAEIHVLNVEMPLDDYGMVPTYVTPRKHRELTQARARAIIEPALARLKRARVVHEAHVLWGAPAESIARAARRLKCESIVMGTRGMGATGNLLLGSTATKVIHLSGVPVTLVK